MNMPNIDPPSYSGYRFPAVIISHCTWLYFRFALSYRDVEEMMAERGVTISYEGIVKLTNDRPIVLHRR